MVRTCHYYSAQVHYTIWSKHVHGIDYRVHVCTIVDVLMKDNVQTLLTSEVKLLEELADSTLPISFSQLFTISRK